MYVHLSRFGRSARSGFRTAGACALLLLPLLPGARAQKPPVRSERPRLWITPERLQRIQEYVARDTDRWTYLKEIADNALNFNVPNREYIPALALAYQATGDQRYGYKAVEFTLETATPDNLLREDDYYYYRDAIPEVSIGLDWCFDLMTEPERIAVATWLMDRADDVWPETNPGRENGWAVGNPGNNYFLGFLMTWPAALAAYDYDERAQYHIQLGHLKFDQFVRPWAESWGRGGIYAEGTNYDSSYRLGLILDANLTATGEDLINAPGFDFLWDSVFWRIYSTTPSLTYYYPLGDQSRESTAPLSDIDRQRALVPMDVLGNARQKAYARGWLDRIDPQVSRTWFALPWEFLYYDEDADSIDYTQELPFYYFAPGAGMFTRRSSWEDDATYWGIWAGPLQESHQSHDVNGIKIYKGGWLLGDANIYSWTGVLSDTQFHNNYTFGGLEQAWQRPERNWPDEAGEVLALENTDQYTYFHGDATQAYVQDRAHDGSKFLDQYRRKVVYVDPDFFVILDRMTLQNGSTPKTLNLHTEQSISLDGNSYVFTNGRYKLFGQTLFPESSLKWETEALRFGYNNSLSSHRLKITLQDQQKTSTMLNAFHVRPANESSGGAMELLWTDESTMLGVVHDGWAILMGRLSDRIDGPGTYHIETTSSTEHLLTDLLPDTHYLISLNEYNAGEITVLEADTSPQGSLRFTLDVPGAYEIIVFPAE